MTSFQVWAPAAGSVSLELRSTTYLMAPAAAAGWWHADVPAAQTGEDYGFRLDDGELLPDPRSPWQPHGPQGMSRTYDHSAFRWTDSHWRGRSLRGAVIYEMHVGTFTPEGTFDAAIGRLDHLVRLGVDVVEVMPVVTFPGTRGWGYDGINLWAVHEAYGGPDGLKRFVDACHARQLAVALDVVYNHVGPGNRLSQFGPYFGMERSTPWGPSVNLDQRGSDEVRTFLIENAIMWLRDYHADGLRLDSVDNLDDRTATHFLEDLGVEVAALGAHLSREMFVIAESSANNPRLVTSRAAGGYGLTAQWSNSLHEAVHAVLTGERQGRYSDYGSLAGLAKVLTKVYFHDGTWSSYRGRAHGRPVDLLRTPAYRFVGYLQNHDQVGNRPAGDRIAALVPTESLKVAVGLTLTGPCTPMLFMGEEWGADTPWQYFTDHPDPALGAAVAAGRKRDLAARGWKVADAPDPQVAATFRRSKLDWSQLEREPHHELLDWYRELIALRRRRAELTDPRLDRVRVDFDEGERWLVIHRGRLRIAVNLADGTREVPLGACAVAILATSTTAARISGDSVSMPGPAVAVVET